MIWVMATLVVTAPQNCIRLILTGWCRRVCVFTNGHASSSTCTPSRFSLMMGQYPWRKEGTGILPGDAALIIPTDKITLPLLFRNAGYQTRIVGKWHLGLGEQVEKNWNSEIKPGPNEVGLDYSFIFRLRNLMCRGCLLPCSKEKADWGFAGMPSFS